MSAPAVSALRGPGGPAVRARPATADARTARLPGGHEPLLRRPVARLLGFGALLLFGAHHWMLMLEPAATARAWYAIGTGLAVALALTVVPRLRPRVLRRTALAAALVAGAALAIVGAGADDAFLAPDRWGDLAAGVQRGLEALPGARVPYRGLDEWLDYVLALGGTGLAILAAALCFWPRRGGRLGFAGAGLVALVALYAVPAVSLNFDAEFVRGGVLALLVVAFLRLERLRRRDAGAGAAVAAAAAVAALAVAPALDRLDPWWDYETWALSAGGAKSTGFVWTHDYGPLRWPRDGRELLRVRSPVRTYWKADQLDVFDGRGWVPSRSSDGSRQAPGGLIADVDPRRIEAWTTRMRVSVRNLRTDTFVTAGTVVDIRMPRRADVPTSRPGVYTSTRALARGDDYEAQVYVPRADRAQLEAAGTDFGGELARYTRVGVRSGGWGQGVDGDPRFVVVAFPGFKSAPTVEWLDPAGAQRRANRLLADSGLDRIWRLARRLRAQSATPYDYVQRVEAHLSRGYRYAEAPPPGSETLDGFLFDTKVGFCQQYSGAMTLLLRLGGVPARVATGFAPGSFDRDTNEYVVRDYDAHSWVEVYYPGIGWVPSDPTPTSAPPRSQGTGEAGPPSLGGARDVGITAQPGTEAPVDGGLPVLAWMAAIVLPLAGLGGLLLRRRRGGGGEPLAELRRALGVAGTAVPSGTTLAELERRFERSAPAVADYVRAVRGQRYAGAPSGPTAVQRRGLRRALARGGPAQHLRAWWALPPRRPGRPGPPTG